MEEPRQVLTIAFGTVVARISGRIAAIGEIRSSGAFRKFVTTLTF